MPKRSDLTAIYKLRNPSEGYKTFYVGQSKDPLTRFWSHLYEYGRVWPVTIAIDQMMDNGILPVMDVVRWVSAKEANEHERRMIIAHRWAGIEIVNAHWTEPEVVHEYPDDILKHDVEACGIYINYLKYIDSYMRFLKQEIERFKTECWNESNQTYSSPEISRRVGACKHTLGKMDTKAAWLDLVFETGKRPRLYNFRKHRKQLGYV